MSLPLVIAALGVNTLFVQLQSCHVAVVDKVRIDNFSDVFVLNPAVPNSFRVNHHRRPMLTLIKTAGFISSNASLKSASGQFLFKQKL